MYKAFSPKKLDLNVGKSCSNSGIKNGAVLVQRLWNDLPYEVKRNISMDIFQGQMKKLLFEKNAVSITCKFHCFYYLYFIAFSNYAIYYLRNCLKYR